MADGEEVGVEGGYVVVLGGGLVRWKRKGGGGIGGGTILYASLRNSSRVSERLRGEGLSLELCLLRRESRRGVRSVIGTVVFGRGRYIMVTKTLLARVPSKYQVELFTVTSTLKRADLPTVWPPGDTLKLVAYAM